MDIRRPDSIKDVSYIEPKQEQKSESPIKQANTGISKAQDSFETVQFGSRNENSLGLTQSNSQTGTKDLNQREEKIANDKAPDSQQPPAQQEFTGNAKTRFDNSREALMNQFTDIFGTRHGDGSMSAGESGSTSGGGGVSSTSGFGSRITDEQRAKFDAMTGNNYGPPTASMDTFKDPAASASSRGGRVYQSGFDLLMDQANDTSSSSGPDKGMISQGVGYGGLAGDKGSEGVKDRGNGQTAKDYPGLANIVKSSYIDGGLTSPRKEMLDAAEKEIAGSTPTTESTSGTAPATGSSGTTEDLKSEGKLDDGTHVKTGKDGTSVITKTDGTQIVLKPDGSRTEIHPDGSYEDYDQKGKQTGKGGAIKEMDQDEYNKGLREKYGLPALDLPKAPKIQGDRDPDPNATNDAAGTDLSLLAQQGMYGLVGQPNEDRFVGGSGNVSTGGNIDYEDQAGWGGREVEEDPSDVDVTPGASQELPPAANQPNQEEKTKTDSRFTKDQPVKASGRENISKAKI